MEKILKDDFLMSTWAGGKTYELYIDPSGSHLENRDFTFRISIASCELEENRFSAFKGYMRYIAPLDKKMTIETYGEKINLHRFEVLSFSGDQKTTSRGGALDFNLIYKRGYGAQMYSLKIFDHQFLAIGKTLIYNYDSDLYIENEKFEKNSAIILEKKEKINISGKGKIIVVVMNN